MKHFYLSVLLALYTLLGQVAMAQTPIFNSYPAAQAVIFLDFDGHTINGTYWNSNGPVVCGPANMNTSQITEIFNRVAEDYRPFNINVTTDSTRYWAAPIKKRMRVVLTTTSSWYGNNAGGVAFTNSFTWGDNTPCFVFTALLGYNAKAIAEASSHEAGHTLGLRHQARYDVNCVKKSDYNDGKGAGETGWAPIMGVGYYKNFTVWNVGPTPSVCTTAQNDLEIITNTKNGIGYRVDDHANSFSEASIVTFTNQQFNLGGIIGKTDDVDMFKFSIAKKGLFRLNAIPYNVGNSNAGSNLDMQVDLLDGEQNVLNSYNPKTALSSIVDTLLNAGTYYLRVDGTGNENASEYGSLGSYSLQGNYIDVTPLPLRRLELQGKVENGHHSLQWLVDADETIERQQLEYSQDGRAFQLVKNVETNERRYRYLPAVTGNVYYRLNIQFDNGKQHYSNIISLRSSATVAQPHLLSTLVEEGRQLQVRSTESYEYWVMDFNGKLLMKGNAKLGTTSIDIQGLNKGSYLVRFLSNDIYTVEKFIKR
jgi:hypothetical protein